MGSPQPQPHTETDHNSDSALAITLIVFVFIILIFAMPWFFDDSWTNGWRQVPQVPQEASVQPFVVVQGVPVPKVVERPKVRLPTADEDERGSSDSPPYAFAPGVQVVCPPPDTPDLSKLVSGMSVPGKIGNKCGISGGHSHF